MTFLRWPAASSTPTACTIRGAITDILNVGTSHDTSQFACDSLAFWYDNFGCVHYPDASSLLLLCDGGGSNAANRYVFKYNLQNLADPAVAAANT